MRHWGLNISIFFCCILAACSSTSQNKALIAKDNNVPVLKTIDNRVSMIPLNGRSIIDGYIFDGVSDFETAYEFNCHGHKYNLAFESQSLENETIKTRILDLWYDNKSLNNKHKIEINNDLKASDVVGPVGLSCELGRKDNAVNLKINTAYIDGETNRYKFKNYYYILTDDSFQTN